MDISAKRTISKASFHTSLTKRLWIFLILGAVIIILGLVNVGLYFNIQAITTSLEHTEILPGYILSLVSVVTGSFIVILFWRRPSCLVIFTLILSVCAALFSSVTAILTVTHIIQPISSLSMCTYLGEKSLCTCHSSFSRSYIHLQDLGSDTISVSFVRTSSCESIQDVLPVLLYSQCAVYLTTFILITVSSVIGLLVLRLERIKRRMEEPYEEIFTVSGGSSTTDSDEESPPDPVVENGKTSSCVVTPLHSRKNFPKSTIQTCPPGILKHNDKPIMQRKPSLVRSKSCDSLDKVNKKEPESSKTLQGKSKLKEHRRRDKRAVTLHNLDTKQLLLILDLRMRYMEETKILKSQGDISKLEAPLHPVDMRRAMTPQPYRKKCQANTLPKIIRSHTPQPGQVTSRQFLENCLSCRENEPNVMPPHSAEVADGASSHTSQDEMQSEEVNVIPRPNHVHQFNSIFYHLNQYSDQNQPFHLKSLCIDRIITTPCFHRSQYLDKVTSTKIFHHNRFVGEGLPSRLLDTLPLPLIS
ncbi:hypothetical protein FSP39_000094 [Pinctada imbricata]|uniref:Uncharacterized protein n=1 Tax=Pinctada imbricata TaxID=66713 RepID=A0AA89BTS4_PINIB|nr:hypothetical protein FSP39_000094 [Pinctada imbricata]